jgi:hypothetical protein
MEAYHHQLGAKKITNWQNIHNEMKNKKYHIIGTIPNNHRNRKY